MVVDFPAIKLGALALRQLSKYVANFFQSKAKKNRIFREYICMPPAQLYNRLEVKTKMWALHMGKSGKVQPLSETAAIELGVSLLGEIVLFTVAAIAVILEVSRQLKNEKRRKLVQMKEMNDLINGIQVTENIIQEQEAYIKAMEKVLSSMGKRIKVPVPNEPFKSKLLRPLIDVQSVAIQSSIPTNTKGTQTGSPTAGWLEDFISYLMGG